ncbi:hypothetical protein F2Q70_00019451 [Brassica cretica]|uniref:Uncharacterized protein n=1 Tax=Brassica cretica TaxID=69181 RepID=A0A8S9GX70_BRACR|nr:hypothetical protein F2Q70_00019451 [Brassica cretica]
MDRVSHNNLLRPLHTTAPLLSFEVDARWRMRAAASLGLSVASLLHPFGLQFMVPSRLLHATVLCSSSVTVVPSQASLS